MVLLAAAILSLVAWIYLTFFHGGFWRADQRLEQAGETPGGGESWPDVALVLPARNEEQVIARSITSLLDQDYPGRLRVILVDDQSTDATARVARAGTGRNGSFGSGPTRTI